MCGIAGIANLRSRDPIEPRLLRQMIRIQSHRGPDESGIYVDDHVGLGQARLSIIDLAGGAQPMSNEDGSIWIVYNGEIFNYVELRKELLERGHRFHTTSDTEVLVHLYEDRGPECLRELNGQFALAIWDSRRRELFLARDRIGIRPLHYAIHNDRLIFASEVKALFCVPDVERRIDPVAMDQIFTFWTTLPGRTVFEGIHELPAGHYLLVRDGVAHVRRFWEIPFVPRCEQIDRPIDDIVEHLDNLLYDAIRIRLRADVPVGCYLSGGVDSSAVTSRVARDFNSRVRSFGIRFEEQAFDEGKHQQLMVDRLGVDHQEIRATNEDIGVALADVMWHVEKPILRTAPVPLFLLSRLVHENNFKVVLTGEGADEFFGGYNIFRETLVRRFWGRQPADPRRAALIGRLYPYIFKNPRLTPTLQAFFAKGIDRSEDPLFSHLVRWDNTRRTKTFFTDDLRRHNSDYDACAEAYSRLPDAFAQWDALSRAQYLESWIFLSNYLLSSQGDRVAMAHSVEIRLPYLDYRVMEYAARIPSRWKILGLKEKHILKKAVRRDLPEEILQRPKHPYRAPISQSVFSEKARPYSDEMLSERALRQAGLFDPRKVAALVEKTRRTDALSEVDNMALAGILTAQIVHDKFISRFPAGHDDLVVKVMVDKRTAVPA